jgi:hypothetical protein
MPEGLWIVSEKSAPDSAIYDSSIEALGLKNVDSFHWLISC